MSTQAAKREMSPRTLIAAVLVLTVVVLGLGGALVVVKLRPKPLPTNAVDRGVTQWEQAVAADPESDSAQTGYGLALLDAGRTDDARQAFEKAVSLNEKNWVALLQLGVIVKADDPARAVDLLDRSAKYAPRQSKAVPLVALGDVYMATGDAESAKDAYRRAIADVPYLFDPHLGLARALEALGDTKGALKEYQEALRYDPDSEEAADAVARLQAGAGTP
jgi:tetratricopeptide (TPR) repeat protein